MKHLKQVEKKRLKYGINQKKAINGTLNTQKIQDLEVTHLELERVQFAEKKRLQNQQQKSIVHEIAKQKQEGRQALIMKLKNAKRAGVILKQINIHQKNIVRMNAG